MNRRFQQSGGVLSIKTWMIARSGKMINYLSGRRGWLGKARFTFATRLLQRSAELDI
jgi:hypothetical protein